MMTVDSPDNYTLAEGADRALRERLLNCASLGLPEEILDAASKLKVTFTPEKESPFLPSSLKLTESSSSLWALLGIFGSAICKNRYGVSEAEIVVDLYSSSLFLMSAVLFHVDERTIWDEHFMNRTKSMDLGQIWQPYRGLATNIYKAKDGKYFHLHGSLNTTAVLHMLDMPQQRPDLTVADSQHIKDEFKAEVAKHDSSWLDIESNEFWRQAGTICYTPEEFTSTPHGHVISKEPLYTVKSVDEYIPPTHWPPTPSSESDRRPLLGIRVLDLTRVIAGPSISRILSLLGAEVLRISSDTLPDTFLLYDTQIGKRDTRLNLKSKEGKLQFRKLLEDADVILDGFRPGALERLGFGRVMLREIAKRRGKGIVHARENCYGWKGEWAHRSGWQQIADAVSGATWAQGKYFGTDEHVIPPLPNSDYQTGIVGAIAICHALMSRSSKGGSMEVDLSLTQYNLWLLSLGLYSDDECAKLRERNSSVSMYADTGLWAGMDMVQQSTKKALGQGPGSMWDPAKFTQTDMRWGYEKETATVLDWSQIVRFKSGNRWFHTIGTSCPGSDSPTWQN